ncbi:MAG: DUF3536 domain-containing protein, partial [Acidimicrobiia bacterium]|nr:DUF3536 domain-containing protein [Acidimicrobiia bacterium]
MTTSGFVCIHGHFYQPPRENPFTGKVDDQPSAAPYPNWNERITAESYTPNLSALVLGGEGEEKTRVNNYSWISFDFGPTLLSWLEANSPETYAGIIDSDRQSISHFGGYGSAMAQSYNHTILPLSTDRDKRTQVKWGIADFVHRFGRQPQGMWLPETAVDSTTLDILAEEGIGFTVLSPYQADSIEDDSGDATDVSGGRIDPRRPYYVETASGRPIAVFFYDGPVSQEIAFNGVLEDGRLLAERLAGVATNGVPGSLAHVATDGETYGHHHRFGEMALAAAIEMLRATSDVELTNYQAYLADHPPETRVRVVENSSWSCAHGVERWRSDCGCSTGGEDDWNQSWRAPLRSALDWLNQRVTADFESTGDRLLTDKWDARDQYIEVLLGRAPEDFIEEHSLPGLDRDRRSQALAQLEIQHRAMLMYTSCGWFFNDLTGLETVFVLRQAGRVIELARRATGIDLEPDFVELLGQIHSNHENVTG